MDLFYVLSGGIVGFIIGLTGVGGGSLMTPLLVMGFGINPAIAVGTDLLYAAITKAGGVFFHQRQGTVDWRIVSLLASGSIPASIATIIILDQFKNLGINYERLMMLTLSAMLILTSIVVFLKDKLLAQIRGSLSQRGALRETLLRSRRYITLLAGIALGILVTISSVGAGAIGSAILFLLYPRKRAIAIVGTDIAHAVPLTAVAGFGHYHVGSVDLVLLLGLLLGGLPAIYFGSLIGKKMPDKLLRPVVACILMTLGLGLAV